MGPERKIIDINSNGIKTQSFKCNRAYILFCEYSASVVNKHQLPNTNNFEALRYVVYNTLAPKLNTLIIIAKQFLEFNTKALCSS